MPESRDDNLGSEQTDSNNTLVSTITPGRTRNQIIDEETDKYIANLNLTDLPTPEEISIKLVQKIEEEISLENKVRPKGNKFRIPDALSFDQIATFMNIMYPIAMISCAKNSDEEYDMLCLYIESGTNEGIYTPSENQFYKIARRFNRHITQNDFKEILMVLRSIAPRKIRCTDKDLVAVNNGILNYATKTLNPFSPDLVFMSKSHVNYNITAKNVVIHNDEDGTNWDIESWINDLSDDPEIVELLWQILGAIIRPNVRWNKSAWLYSEEGNNGKGTLCELMRSLCGENAYASIPLCNFSKDFMLEPLTRSTAIIVDENNVNEYIDKVANLKAVITNDVISINRKYKIPINYQFYGFMVQCLNGFPKISDKSDSFYRRQLFIPFDKCFTGKERKYIKNDYLHRPEVLEYVLYKVLNMNYYTLIEPQACKNVLEEYKMFNDPVRQYFEEFTAEWSWDLLPFSWLYALYKQWFRLNSPNGTIQGKQKFINEIVNIANQSNEWYCMDKNKNIRVGTKMDRPEHLIADFGVLDWKNQTYAGSDIDVICTPAHKDFYRGLLRYDNSSSLDTADANTSITGGDTNADSD